MSRTGSCFFLVRYDIGSNYLRDHPLSEQPGFAEHAKYMNRLHSAGALLFGGLLLNHAESFSVTGGALLLCACSEGEANDLAMKDPAVKGSVFRIREIKHCLPTIGNVSETTSLNALCSPGQ
jgi:hypothetical protein